MALFTRTQGIWYVLSPLRRLNVQHHQGQQQAEGVLADHQQTEGCLAAKTGHDQQAVQLLAVVVGTGEA
ncbi:hypothetical protein, partial [Escherichia coli]|uniref:hypothetical protein n=1 Tax=Escherichia coli TaxID=562 RepID=UPI0028DF79E5